MYQIEMWTEGRWVLLGGKFETKQAAEAKISEYHECDTKEKRRQYRIVRR